MPNGRERFIGVKRNMSITRSLKRLHAMAMVMAWMDGIVDISFIRTFPESVKKSMRHIDRLKTKKPMSLSRSKDITNA